MKPVLAVISIAVVFILFSCDDIFLKNISEDQVTVFCPSEGFTTTSSDEILFWWGALDGADKYDLQIVSPDFENIKILNLDVELDTVKHSITLPEGDYQWRIRAVNGSYATEYETRNLHITAGLK